MARIPGVPDLEPVSRPYISPQEAGQSGVAIAEMGQEISGIASEGLALQAHIRKAQAHVDSLAASNELDAAFRQMQTDLAKTQNSQDVPQVVEHYKESLNEISKKWSQSPAAIQIQMSADSLRPEMDQHAQLRQVDLMGKEFKIALNHQGQILSQDYASARAAGDSGGEAAALDAYSRAVEGGVQTGLIGQVEAQENIRQFRRAGQTMEVRQALDSLNPETNQKMINELTSSPDKFPDLTKEEIGDLIERGNTAFINHTRQKEWAQNQLVKQTVVPAIIKDNTDTQTGIFHLDQALKAVSHLPPEQEAVAAEEVRSHAANANADLLDRLNKADNQIESAIAHNDFRGARQITDALRATTEQAGLPWFSSQTRIIDAARRQHEAEYRANFNFDTRIQKAQETASSTFLANQLIPRITSGQITQQDLNNAVGEGPGKINYRNYLQLTHLLNQVQKEPDTQAALNVLYDSLPAPPKTAPADQQAQYDMMKWNLYEQWQQGVAEKQLKGEDKTKYAIELVKPFVAKDVADRLDQLLGGPQQTQSQSVKSFIGTGLSWIGIATPWQLPEVTPSKSGFPSTPKEGDKKKNSSGDNLIYRGGKWVIQ